ncbi:MAG: DUF447 family protein [Planctomycetota bacterium]|jgi:hypothetical protein|nr:DUF447 family protein [Planctomycetota bacterium]
MIIEGIITTTDAAGQMHLAAMGPHVDEEAGRTAAIERLSLRPFATSQTATNLATVPEGVFHLVDDVLLFARVVTKSLTEPPICRLADRVRGWVLDDACRAYEFRIEESDTTHERLRHEACVVKLHEGRPFVGFNRAKHAVVEAAILVTRVHLLGTEEIRRQMAALQPLVEKTGGSRERAAWEAIERYVG